MYLTKVAPAVAQTVTTPVKHNLLRHLRIPALATAMFLCHSVKAQTKNIERDVFQPVATAVSDTTKHVIQDSLKVADTIPVGDTVKTIKKHPLELNTNGSAAAELYTKVIANISENGENPYSSLYGALNEMQNNGTPSYVISNQLNDLIENMQLYENDHKEDSEELMLQNGSITEFKYGPDGSKTGTIIQNLNITGINQKDNQDTISDSTATASIVNNNDFIGNIAYRMKAVTEKAEVETNIHAGSDDLDVQLAAMYKTKTTNDGNLSVSINGRQTIEGATSDFSAGTSVDYNKNDFSTGLYYFYNRDVDESGFVDKNSQLQGYLKYKNNVNLAAGIQDYDFIKYYYSKLKLSGMKNLDDINMKLSGALAAEVGSYNIDYNSIGYGQLNLTNLDFSAIGGAYFKTDDITASLNGRVSYNYIIAPDGDNSGDFSMSLLGAFSKGNIAVSAMVSMFRDLFPYTAGTEDAAALNNTNISACVGFEIKDLLKGVSPQFSYTSVSINNQVQHFFNVTLKTSLEALKKTQK